MDDTIATPVDSMFENILGPEYWVANSGVTRRSWEILLLRKGMIDDHLWSLAECATRYGVSRERVRQLEQDAVTKLLNWKKAEDLRRQEERARLFRLEMCERRSPSQPQICSSFVREEASLSAMEALPAAMEEHCNYCLDVSALHSDSTPPPRRFRNFAELRDEVLLLISEF